MSIALVNNTTDSRKVTSSYTEAKPKGASFGPAGPHVPAIDGLAAGTSGYDAKLAYVMAVVSAWAYADERALAEKLRYYGIEKARVRRIAVQNNALLIVATAYFIQSASGRTGILAFRGTDPASFITILADTEVMQRPFAGGVVHSGFYANVEAVWDDVTACLAAARQGYHLTGGEEMPAKPEPGAPDGMGTPVKLAHQLEHLYITGHSLGGAMAVLAAARLLGQGFDNTGTSIDPGWAKGVAKGVYTFGQPMVGDPAFARFCEKSFGTDLLFRHVFRDDVVPHAPPTSSKLVPWGGRPEYQHTGKERHARGLNDVWAERAASRRAGVAEALLEIGLSAVEARFAPSAPLKGLSIDDHLPSNYLDVSRFVLDSISAPVLSAGPIAKVRGAVVSLLEKGKEQLQAAEDGVARRLDYGSRAPRGRKSVLSHAASLLSK
jgi:hypothetical protein